MQKTLGMLLLLAGMSAFCFAQNGAPAPEVDPASAGSALALVTGALLVIRGRKK